MGVVVTALSAWTVARRLRFDDTRRAEAESREREAQRQLAQRNLVQLLIDVVKTLEEHHVEEGGRYRANVMLLDPSGQALTIAYNTPGYAPEEIDLWWYRGEGGVGQAWVEGRTVVAPTEQRPLPEGASDAGKADRWNMTEEQIVHGQGAGLQMIVSVPIFQTGNPSEILGVLDIDDTLPPGRHTGAVVATAERLALRVKESLAETREAL